MATTVVKKNNALRQNSFSYFSPLTFPSLSPVPENICQNISQNLFQVEKDMLYFQLAIKEISDVIEN